MYWKTEEQRIAYQKEYGIKNKEKISKNKKEYRLKNLEILKEKHKKYYANDKEGFRKNQIEYYAIPENRAKRILCKARETARRRGHEFNLDISDIVIPEYCPLLGIKLTHDLGRGQLQSNSSIDRIDSSKGYIKGNVQIISRLANSMKTNATKEQLIEFAKNVLRIYE